MCQDCKAITWEIDETEPVAAYEKHMLTFLENDCLEVWTEIVKTHEKDQIATFLTQIIEAGIHPSNPESIHPLIGRFCSTYEKILTDPEKKFVFFEHFCMIALSPE